VQETVAVPELVTPDGLMVLQFSPDGTESVRLTVPVNPFRAVIVIVDWAEAPTAVASGDDAEIVKSSIEKTVEAEWESVPVAPMIVAR
jgi:hypothetical protein